MSGNAFKLGWVARVMVFKAYDIRGIYGSELTEELAYKVGRALARYLRAKTIVVGHDMRSHSPGLYDAVINGVRDEGCKVLRVGLCSTPALYFAVNRYGADGGAMITASHNPPEYNGIKMTREEAIPIGQGAGMEQIEELASVVGQEPVKQGEVVDKDMWQAYKQHVCSFLPDPKPLKVVVDAANGMAGYTVPRVFANLPFTMVPLFFELDGTFPNHEANPLKEENTALLQQAVREHQADIGIAFDGDADRAFFITEQGERVAADVVEAVIAAHLLKKHPGELVLYDVRSSWVVKETVEQLGGKAKMCRVGHAFIKRQLRESHALFAGELAGHYYYRDNFCTDSGMVTAMVMLEILGEAGKPLSEVIQPYVRYAQSGEINLTVAKPEQVVAELQKRFSDGQVSLIDGVRVEYADFWFSVRKSNTEPVVRLNVEAKTADVLQEKKKELVRLIGVYGA